MITVTQAELEFNIPARTLRGAIARDEIPSRMMGKTHVLNRADVRRWAANRPKPGPRPGSKRHHR